MSAINRMKLIRGDITKYSADVIVNAANSTLLGGGGVDGAIHRSAGPELLKECQALGGCLVGEAKLTKGYNLKAKYIIHTVGPLWEDGNGQEHILLSDCYRNALQLAVNHNFKTVAFPNISTGSYQFPKAEAASIAFREVSRFLENDLTLEMVTFVCFDEENYKEYQKFFLKTPLKCPDDQND